MLSNLVGSFMKSFIVLVGSFISLSLMSCDQHSWEDTTDSEGTFYPGTKRFYTDHHDDDHYDKTDHGSSKKDDHGKDHH